MPACKVLPPKVIRIRFLHLRVRRWGNPLEHLFGRRKDKLVHVHISIEHEVAGLAFKCVPSVFPIVRPVPIALNYFVTRCNKFGFMHRICFIRTRFLRFFSQDAFYPEHIVSNLRLVAVAKLFPTAVHIISTTTYIAWMVKYLSMPNMGVEGSVCFGNCCSV